MDFEVSPGDTSQIGVSYMGSHENRRLIGDTGQIRTPKTGSHAKYESHRVRLARSEFSIQEAIKHPRFTR